MKIDVGEVIGAVTRTVEQRDHDGRPARVVIVTRTFAAEVGDVWDAMTNAERIPRWFLPIAGEVSWLMVRLSEPAKAMTLLELEHVAHVDDERWKQFGPGAVGVGWDMALMGLGRHLTTGASADPKAAMAWLGSPEGKAFVAMSSNDWGRASVAAGTDAAQAHAAAERTTAAYTGAAPSTK